MLYYLYNHMEVTKMIPIGYGEGWTDPAGNVHNNLQSVTTVNSPVGVKVTMEKRPDIEYYNGDRLFIANFPETRYYAITANNQYCMVTQEHYEGLAHRYLFAQQSIKETDAGGGKKK